MRPELARGPGVKADVCLLLEGTYPFIRGGVSSWVHQLIEGLDELSFSLVFLGGRRADYGSSHYTLPRNVVSLQTHYLEEASRGVPRRSAKMSAEQLATIERLHRLFKRMAERTPAPGERAPSASRCPVRPRLDAELSEMLETLGSEHGVSLQQFLGADESWQFMREQFLAAEGSEGAFLDYFWALRMIHVPLFGIAQMAEELPDAGLYHSISTGYAGLLGAFASRRRQRPLIITEHGIYTKERRIDLAQAEWHSAASEPNAVARNHALQDLWIRFFETIGRIAYGAASSIVSLYGANEQRQWQDGAPPERTRVIANGVDLERFKLSEDTAAERAVPRIVGLVGRVVPIKDIKTFIRAIGVLRQKVPDAIGWVIGGADEDRRYESECRALVRSMGLEASVVFKGHQNVAEILPQLGLLMLSSISEAQPLVILEAFASGLPCVATDVGSCRELILGRTPEDRELGAAGAVAAFADHEGLGEAAAELLTAPSRWRACQRAALRRVTRYYGLETMLGAYRSLYGENLEGIAWRALASA